MMEYGSRGGTGALLHFKPCKDIRDKSLPGCVPCKYIAESMTALGHGLGYCSALEYCFQK